MNATKNIKGNKITAGTVILGIDADTKAAMLAAGVEAPADIEVLEIGINGKRHREATVRQGDLTFTMRFDPRETYTVAA